MKPINPAAILASPTAASALPPDAQSTSRPASDIGVVRSRPAADLGAERKSQPQVLQRLQPPALDAWHRPELKPSSRLPELPAPPESRGLRVKDERLFDQRYARSNPLPDAAHFYPTLRDGFGNNLLMYACASGNAELVAFLLEICPPSWAQALNMFGLNAAMIARDYGHAELLPMLGKAGVEQQQENPAL